MTVSQSPPACPVVPEEWLLHANRSVTDGYSKLKEDVTFRKKVAEQVGIGFELPTEELSVFVTIYRHSSPFA